MLSYYNAKLHDASTLDNKTFKYKSFKESNNKMIPNNFCVM